MPDKHGNDISEKDLTDPALTLLANAPDGFLETTALIERLEAIFQPMGKDAEIIDGRDDNHFSQKVRNIISHRDSPNNPIAKGLIIYKSSENGVQITDKGLAKLGLPPKKTAS